jgi:hypothetical protein
MTFLMDRQIAKSGKLAAQERDDETYVLTLADTTLHHLGDIETFVWKAVDGSRTGRQLVDIVCSEYDVDRAVVERDLPEFLGKMEAAGLISSS